MCFTVHVNSYFCSKNSFPKKKEIVQFCVFLFHRFSLATWNSRPKIDENETDTKGFKRNLLFDALFTCWRTIQSCTHYDWIHSFNAKANGNNKNENSNQCETKNKKLYWKRNQFEISNTKLGTKIKFFSSFLVDTMNWV